MSQIYQLPHPTLRFSFSTPGCTIWRCGLNDESVLLHPWPRRLPEALYARTASIGVWAMCQGHDSVEGVPVADGASRGVRSDVLVHAPRHKVGGCSFRRTTAIAIVGNMAEDTEPAIMPYEHIVKPRQALPPYDRMSRQYPIPMGRSQSSL